MYHNWSVCHYVADTPGIKPAAYLEEFYRILKSAIEETELLIQAKDRELFEDILSQTISQQLTDRIAESKKWVTDMSVLMKQMDTSMGLHFSLEWKPRKAENDAELDTSELEQILLRDRELLTTDDIEKVAAHFRSKIRTEKQKVEEADGMINYMDLVRDALDYRHGFLTTTEPVKCCIGKIFPRLLFLRQ